MGACFLLQAVLVSPSICHTDEVQAIATLIEKQAQIVVKPRVVSEEEKQRKAALLAQYADVTDEEEYPFWRLSTVPLRLVLGMLDSLYHP